MTGKDFRIRFQTEVETTNASTEIDNLINAQRQKLADALKLDIKLDSQKIDAYFNNLNTKISASVSELNNLERIMTQIQLDNGKRINITSSLSSVEGMNDDGTGNGVFAQQLDRTNYRTQTPLKDVSAMEKMKELYKDLEVAQKETMSALRANDTAWANEAKAKIDMVREKISSLAVLNPDKFTTQDLDSINRSSASMDSQIASMEKINSEKKNQELSNKQLLSTLEKHRQLVMDIQNMEQRGYRGPELEQYKSQLTSVNEELAKQYGNNKEMATSYVKQTEAMAEKSKLQHNISTQDKNEKTALDSLKDSSKEVLKFEEKRATLSKMMQQDVSKRTKENQNEVDNLNKRIAVEKTNIKNQTEILRGTRLESEAKKVNNKLSEDMTTLDNKINAQGSLKKSMWRDIASGAREAAARVIDYTIAYRALWFFIQKTQEAIQVVFDLNKVFTDIQMVTEYTTKQVYELSEAYSKLAIEMGTTIKEVAEGSVEWLNKIGHLYRNI